MLSLEHGQLRSALQDLHSAILIYPGNDGYFLARGRIYLSLGKCAKAKQDFQEALNLNPLNQQARLEFLKAEHDCAQLLHRLKFDDTD